MSPLNKVSAMLAQKLAQFGIALSATCANFRAKKLLCINNLVVSALAQLRLPQHFFRGACKLLILKVSALSAMAHSLLQREGDSLKESPISRNWREVNDELSTPEKGEVR